MSKSPHPPARGVTVLVLAAQRDGAIDPLAARFGATHKCIVPIAGQPLIAHVLTALAAAPEIARIIISIDTPSVLESVPIVGQLAAQGRLCTVVSRPNLAESVIAAAEEAQFPLLITTADNALLTPAAIATMAREMGVSGAAIGAAFARKEAILAAHPDGQRRFYEFADGGYSNCNCYWIADRNALRAADIFREGGQFAKHPLRIASAFGILNLIRFRLGIGTLKIALARFSRRLGLALRPVVFPDGRLAIDVDNERTYAIVAQFLQERENGDGVSAAVAEMA